MSTREIRIVLATPRGPVAFAVAAVYHDYTTDRGVVAMDRGTFARHYGELRPTSLTVYLRAGTPTPRECEPS